jgi:hypothetical protein
MLFIRDIRHAAIMNSTPSSCFTDLSCAEADMLKAILWCRVLGKIAGLVAVTVWFLRHT